MSFLVLLCTSVPFAQVLPLHKCSLPSLSSLSLSPSLLSAPAAPSQIPEAVWCWVSSSPSRKLPQCLEDPRVRAGRGIWTWGFQMGVAGFSPKLSWGFISFQCDIPASITGLDFCLFPFSSSHQICLHRRITRTEGEARSFSPFFKILFWHPLPAFCQTAPIPLPLCPRCLPSMGDTQCQQCQAW